MSQTQPVPTEMEELRDKVQGLSADLDDAVAVAVSRGALVWARANYPGHPSLHSEAEPLGQAAAAGRTALRQVLAEVRAMRDAGQQISAQALVDLLEASIETYEPDAIEVLRQKEARAFAEVAKAERAACARAIGRIAAPVVGTPYSVGPRRFIEAICQMPDVTETSAGPEARSAAARAGRGYR